MNDQPPESRPVLPPDPDAQPTQSLPTPAGPPAAGGSAAGEPVAPARKQPLKDRLWSLRAVIAVALASVIIGGLGGAALASASQGGDDTRRGPGRFQRGGPGGPPGMMNPGRGRQGFPDRRGQGQRQFQYGDGPSTQPSAPAVPLPSSTN